MNVESIMSRELCSVDPESSLGEATTVMGERHIGSAMVLEGDRLVGILTERDVVRAMSTAHDAPLRPVVEWMTKGPVTVDSSVAVKEALRIMVEGGFRHLPVLDGDRVVGMLSMRDIARALAD